MKYFPNVFPDGPLTLPVLEVDMEVVVVMEAPQVDIPLVLEALVEAVLRSPDSSVEQFRLSSARLSHSVREVFIVLNK